MRTKFSHDIRVLMCTQCGAPLEAEPGGGTFPCSYCGVTNQIVPRQTDARLAPPAPENISEEERLNRLRAQDGKPLLPPDSIKGLISGGGIPAWKVQEAIAVFQGTRKEVESSSDFAAAEQLLFLTLVLNNHFSKENDTTRQRALLESAVEAFKLPRHKQFVLGILSRRAVIDGDLQAAKEWLKPCDPRSDDLQADSSYRLSRALIDTAEGMFDQVHKILGANQQDVPIVDAMDALATLLRANAWEKQGRLDNAEALLKDYMGEGAASGRMSLQRLMKAYEPLQLCQKSFASAQAGYAEQASSQASAMAGGWVGTMLYGMGIVFLSAVFVLVVLGIVTGNANYFVPCIGLGIAGAVTFFLGRGMHRAAKKARYLRVHGISTTGTVVNVATTGTKVNNVPQYKVTLSIQLEGKQPYQASTRLLMPPHLASQMSSGAQLPVRVDPNDPQSVLLELD